MMIAKTLLKHRESVWYNKQTKYSLVDWTGARGSLTVYQIVRPDMTKFLNDLTSTRLNNQVPVW